MQVNVTMMTRCRDNRQVKQKEILNRFDSPCVSYSLNIPGTVKDSPLYRKVFFSGLKALSKTIYQHLLYCEVRLLPTGPEAYIAVDKRVEELKQIAVDIEETHYSGRVFDMDVLDKDGRQCSRRDLGFPPRTCLVCNRPAAECSRSRRHGINEILTAVESICLKS